MDGKGGSGRLQARYCFDGARCAFPIRNEQWMWPLLTQRRWYANRPYPTIHASAKMWISLEFISPKSVGLAQQRMGIHLSSGTVAHFATFPSICSEFQAIHHPGQALLLYRDLEGVFLPLGWMVQQIQGEQQKVFLFSLYIYILVCPLRWCKTWMCLIQHTPVSQAHVQIQRLDIFGPFVFRIALQNTLSITDELP